LEYINATLLAQIFNLGVFLAIIYFIYRVYKNSVAKEEIRRKHEELVISKLDTLIESNKKLADYLMKK